MMVMQSAAEVILQEKGWTMVAVEKAGSHAF